MQDFLGILFNLPLKKPSKNSNGSGLSGLENTLDCDGESSIQFNDSVSKASGCDQDDDDDNEDDESMSWLEEMGLETTTFPELNPNKIKMYPFAMRVGGQS